MLRLVFEIFLARTTALRALILKCSECTDYRKQRRRRLVFVSYLTFFSAADSPGEQVRPEPGKKDKSLLTMRANYSNPPGSVRSCRTNDANQVIGAVLKHWTSAQRSSVLNVLMLTRPFLLLRNRDRCGPRSPVGSFV